MHDKHSHLPTHIFIKRLTRNIAFGALIIFMSLLIGMAGYRYFEDMTWVDAFASASMILSGMGPFEPLHTTGGKIFAGIYAIFSGVLFLIVIALIFAPVIHRALHSFHFADEEKTKTTKKTKKTSS